MKILLILFLFSNLLNALSINEKKYFFKQHGLFTILTTMEFEPKEEGENYAFGKDGKPLKQHSLILPV